jgi:hypothetical protein
MTTSDQAKRRPHRGTSCPESECMNQSPVLAVVTIERLLLYCCFSWVSLRNGYSRTRKKKRSFLPNCCCCIGCWDIGEGCNGGRDDHRSPRTIWGKLLLLFATKNAGKGKGFRHFHVALASLFTKVVLGLGKGMTLAGCIHPFAVHIRTAFRIEFIKILEFERLTNILLVIGILLGLIGSTDLLVLRQGQTGRYVRIRRDFACFQL